MLLTSLITAAEETHPTELISPIVVGAIALGLLLVLLVGLLMFGKGREHS
jgi:hypothetical protein